MRNSVSTYANPVYRGDYPDPSLIRVGKNDFWATTTSTDWAPQFPLLHSRDLVNWEQTSAVFEKRPPWTVGKYWAPEISYFEGLYYVYYVAEREKGPLSIGVATARHPAGPYQDHGPLIGQSSGSIDPTPIVGEDGLRYLIWKEDGNSRSLPTIIWIQQLTIDGRALCGDPFPIMTNDSPWEGPVVEGPSVMRRNGWFYMFYSGNACCGKACKYAVGVARSRSVLGPWEKHPGNPILKGNDDWRCPGHGSIVDTDDGRTYYLYHAYSKRDSIYVGRQALLDEVTWTPQEWPEVNAGRGPSSIAVAPLGVLTRKQKDASKYHDAFRKRKLAQGWQWPQSREPKVTFADGFHRGVILSTGPQADASDTIASVLARPSEWSEYCAETAIDVRALATDVQAGIAAYGDHENALGIAVRNNEILVWRRNRGRHRIVATKNIGRAGTIRLRMCVTEGYRFEFRASTDGLRWTDMTAAPASGGYVPPWDRGIRIALTCGGARDASARFKWLRITPSRKLLPAV